MQTLIDGPRKRCGVWDDRRAPSTINFGGLSPLEVRGQCALARATVQDHLPSPEHDAIYARFGHQVIRQQAQALERGRTSG